MNRRHTFYVPAVVQPMRWAFHSCNGLSANTNVKVWGEPHLWKDVMKRHSQQHLHAVVGGGDQVYNDGFWKTKPFQDWLAISGDKVRRAEILPVDLPNTLVERLPFISRIS